MALIYGFLGGVFIFGLGTGCGLWIAWELYSTPFGPNEDHIHLDEKDPTL